MSKLRVLFDADPLVGQKTGIGTYVENLMGSVAEDHKDKVSLTGFYFDFLGLFNKQPPVIAGIRYKKIRWFPKRLLSIARRLGFQWPINLIYPGATKFDLIIYTDFVALPSLPHIPYCLIIHDISFIDYPQHTLEVNRKFLNRFVPHSLKKADGVIYISEFTKARAEKLFEVKDKPSTIVYPALPKIPATFNKKESNVRPIVYIGTIEPRKNIKNLLIAYEKLPKNLQKQHPLVLGGGKGWNNEDIMTKLNELESKGLPVSYRGFVSNQQKAALYSQAALVVLISHYEGFGIPILEAMAYGSPMLLSDIPVFHEVAGESAYYCDKDSPDDIAQKLQIALDDKSAKNKVANYPKIMKKFSRNNSSTKFVEFLGRVLNK